jgi:hypothetical protein
VAQIVDGDPFLAGGTRAILRVSTETKTACGDVVRLTFSRRRNRALLT